ncbi:monooxygenase [bacterium]|nr:monooxygenase [bacterium]
MSLIGQRVTVLGAGVAGLAVARALALRGARVCVLEQADAIREVGAGLQISPNGAAVLKALGLGTALEAASVRASAVELRDGLTGGVVTRLDVARLRPQQGYHFVHRADLIGLLQAGAREAGVEMRLLQHAQAVDLAGERPVLQLETGPEAAELLIGADGLHSPTRVALNGAEAPFFTGQVAWRALIPGQGAGDTVEVHMGPGRHLVSYPLRGGALRNIVAVEERRAWVEEGWALRDDPLEVRLAFESFAPRVRGWLDQVEDVWLWGLFRHEVARVWHRTLPEGGVAILGDAAHPTLPFLAQGACMALEDAWVLAASLAETDSLAAGLADYEQRRKPRCSRIVAAANANARAYHLSGLARSVAHLGLRLGGHLAPGLALSRFDWLYGFDVTTAQPPV